LNLERLAGGVERLVHGGDTAALAVRVEQRFLQLGFDVLARRFPGGDFGGVGVEARCSSLRAFSMVCSNDASMSQSRSSSVRICRVAVSKSMDAG